ncbi:MAG TPA: hypothetical protein VKU60_03285, partial [Chloroflexota bacterium]|nr:hypothetical protein [Chloroflexota bacterium]
HTGQMVDDTVLAIGSDMHVLGKMTNGQRKSVAFTFTPGASSSGPDAQRVKGALGGGGTGQDPFREAILDSLLGANTNAPSAGLSGLTLLGWMAKSPLPVDVEGLHPSVTETNLYVAPIPLQFPRATPITIPPALIETKQIGTFSTNYGPRNGKYELNPAGSVAIEFTLPVVASDLMSNNLVLHMNGSFTGNQRVIRQPAPGDSLGQIFLYNWSSSDWDAQDFIWGDNPIADPAPYLSATNSFRLRYTYKPPQQQATTSLQFSLDLTDQGQLR